MKRTKEELEQLFHDFNRLNIMIIGDVMIDSYIWGKVNRISPEAPVPIVEVNKREHRLGGAANVALNIQAMGATPILCSVVGDDMEGNDFNSLLASNNQSAEGIVHSENRITTKKTRIIGNNHQMLRIDGENRHALSESEEKEFIERIISILNQQKIDAIIFEDYDKGCITKSLIEKVVKLAEAKEIPTTVDPKKNNFLDFKNVDLFKPNLKELKEGLNIEFDHRNMEELEEAIHQL